VTRVSRHSLRVSFPKRLARDRRGVSLVEFGLLAPVMCLLLVGALDFGHSLYMKSVIEGAVQKAARDTGLEGGLVADNRTAIDNQVRVQLLNLADNADITISRRFYRSFSEADAATPESFTDTNGNGDCDNGEPYEDRNNNNVRDLDGADEGQGGARDAVLYTVTVSYPRMFPLDGFIDVSPDKVVTASTVMGNQPYAEQTAASTPTVRQCPMV
jgi:Flp pilus assembly protein TadG